MKILRGFIAINYIITVVLYFIGCYQVLTMDSLFMSDFYGLSSLIYIGMGILLTLVHYIAIYFSYEEETRKEHNTFLCCSTITFLLCIIAYIYEPKAVRPYSEADFKSLIPLLLYIMAVLFFVVQVVGAVRLFIKKQKRDR